MPRHGRPRHEKSARAARGKMQPCTVVMQAAKLGVRLPAQDVACHCCHDDVSLATSFFVSSLQRMSQYRVGGWATFKADLCILTGLLTFTGSLGQG